MTVSIFCIACIIAAGFSFLHALGYEFEGEGSSFNLKRCDGMQGQMHNTVGVSFHTTILCLFHHARNDFVE